MTLLHNAAERTLIVETTPDTAPWLAWAFGVSIVIHALAYGSLSDSPPQSRARLSSAVSFEVEAAKPPAPLPEAAPTPAPAPSPPKAPPRATAAMPRSATPAAAERAAQPASETPRVVDLTGITLAGGDGAFDAPLGNGAERSGPLGPISTTPAPKPALAGQPAPAPAPSLGPRLVALGDLSSKPAPPALDMALRSNYPVEARRRGIAGNASVRARIDADGVVRQISILGESFAGFAEACRRTLKNSKWSPPRDAAGERVATEVRYTCRFVVMD